MQKHEIQVTPMRAFGSDVHREAAAVFVDGYYPELSFLSKDREKLIDAFRKMIGADAFYVATLDRDIVGILACSDNRMRAMRIDPAILRQAFGLVKGTVAYAVMKGEFNRPLSFPDDTGYIECVATAVRARGKGVSTALFRYVLENARYERYVLEVVDTNETACRIYKKLGFTEIERKKERFSKFKGFNERIYMSFTK